MLCGGQTLAEFVQGGSVEVTSGCGHVTRKCIVLELTTSPGRLYYITVLSEYRDRWRST